MADPDGPGVAEAHSPQEAAEPSQPPNSSPEAPLVAVSGTQESPRRVTDNILDQIEEKAAADWDSMKQRIQAAADPAAEAKQRLFQSCLDAFNTSAPAEPATVATLVPRLMQADAALRDSFFNRWSRLCYDENAVGMEYNLHKMPADNTLKDYFANQVESFYLRILDKNVKLAPLEDQRKTPLEATCPSELATACQRVSQGGGCPGDGHLIHAAYQAQAVFGFAGQKTNAVRVVAVQGTEGDWNVVGSRLSQVVLGASSDGKDNVKNVVLGWLQKNQVYAPSATSVQRQGHITVHGLLKRLPQTQNQLQIVNGEIEKVLAGATKSNYLTEEDLIEICDGSDSLGKATAQTDQCLACHCLLWMGSTTETYVKQMSASSNGRARLAVLTFDGDNVRERPFEESFWPRKSSDELLTKVLGFIYQLQHRPVAEPPRAGAAPKAQGKALPRPKMRARRQRATVKAKALPKTQPTITEVTWTPSAGSVLAGVSEGSGRAVNKCPKACGASAVRKHAGRLYGAVALSNLACRNGLLAYALSDHLPEKWQETFVFDSQIRLLDAVAAVPRMELFSCNQLYLERLIAAEQSRQAKSLPAAPAEDDDAMDFYTRLPSPDQAVLRLLEGIVQEIQPWKDAIDHGIPNKIGAGSLWFNVRQRLFTRKRKRADDLDRYGGNANCNLYGDSQGWQNLLHHLAEQGVGRWDQEQARLRIKKSRAGVEYLNKEIRAHRDVVDEYGKLA